MNTSTGDYAEIDDDSSIPGKGSPLSSTRTYNSLNNSVSGPFGPGWSFSYGAHLEIDPDSGAITVVQGSGAEVEYTATAGGFTASPRVTATLEEDGGGYLFTTTEGLAYSFDDTGQLTSIADRNGYTTTVTRPDADHLVVTDPSGRELTYTQQDGHIVKLTDPAGRETGYGYDGAGDLTEVTDALGRKTTYTYDAAHRLLTRTDPRGGTTINAYDDEGRVVDQTDPMGRETTYDYTSISGATKVTHPGGEVTVERYEEGFLASKTEGWGAASAATWEYEYDPATGGRVATTDPLSHKTRRTYDASGNVLSETDALGDKATFTYNALNEVLTATDPDGTTTSYEYDGDGNLLKKETPLEGSGEVAETTYGYEGDAGEVTTVTDPDGHQAYFGYDGSGNRTSVTDADGNESSYSYNADGEVIGKTDPDGNTTTYERDGDGELTKETNPLRHTTEFGYDADGNKVSITDAKDQTTRWVYDADGELIEVQRPDGSKLKTRWDAAGNMTAQIDGAGHATTYGYDILNRLTSTTDADGRTTSYHHDAAGRTTAMVDPESQTTGYAYDAAGRLTETSYSDGATPSVEESYDADGRRIEMTDGSGTSTYSYDSLGRLVSTTDGSGATVGYEYDLAGNLLALTYPNGRRVTQTHDAAGRLTAVTDWLGNTTSFGYDANGNLTDGHYPGDVDSEDDYDADDYLEKVAVSNDSGTLASFDYTRNPLGQVTQEEASNGSQESRSFGYDVLNQLTSENQTAFGYDAADNPVTYGAASQTFDPADQLTSSTSSVPSGPPPPGPPVEEQPGGSGGSSQQSAPPHPSASTGPQPAAPPAPETRHETRGAQRRAASIRIDDKASAEGRHRKLNSPPLRMHGRRDLLLAFISAAGPARGGQRVTRVSGGGLHWARLARSSGRAGAAEVWQARAAGEARAHRRLRVTAHLRFGRHEGELTVVALRGPRAHVKRHVARQGRNSRPLMRLAVSQGSQLWGVGIGLGAKKKMRPVGGKIVARAADKRRGSSSWVQRAMATKARRSSLGVRPSAKRWRMVVVAVSPGRAAGAAHSSSVEPSAAQSPSPTPIAAPPPRADTDISQAPRAVFAAVHPQGATPTTRATRHFSYDQRGNRTREELPSGRFRALTYDQADHLIGVDDTVRYSYSGNGLRAAKVIDGTTTTFVWNQAEALPELLEAGSTYYVYGPGGEPVEQITNGTPTYLHQDQHGSTRLMTNSGGEVGARYDYTAWGAVASHTGTEDTDLQYDGQYADSATGFRYLRARYYDPATGLSVTVDPFVPLTREPYVYTDDDPLNGDDPSGLLFGGIGNAVRHGISAVGRGITASLPYTRYIPIVGQVQELAEAAGTCSVDGWASDACSNSTFQANVDAAATYGSLLLPTGSAAKAAGSVLISAVTTVVTVPGSAGEWYSGPFSLGATGGGALCQNQSAVVPQSGGITLQGGGIALQGGGVNLQGSGVRL